MTPDLRFEGANGGNGGCWQALGTGFKRTSYAKTLQKEEHLWNMDRQNPESSLRFDGTLQLGM